MENDFPPQDAEILAKIDDAGGLIDPTALIKELAAVHDFENVIEGIQRAIERGKITLSDEGMVIAMQRMAVAA